MNTNYRNLAAFALRSFIQSGPGYCAIKDGLEYLTSFTPDTPTEIAGMLETYDPVKELVYLYYSDSGSTTSAILDAEKIGCTPLDAYRESLRKKGEAFVPGVGLIAKKTRMPRTARE